MNLSGLNKNEISQVIVQALDKNSNVIYELQIYDLIDKTSLNEKTRNSDLYSSPNPNDFIVTYNDNTTINVYLHTRTVSDENLYNDALLYNDCEYDNNYNLVKFIDPHYNLGNLEVAVFENLRRQVYCPYYYRVYKK